MMRAPVGLMRLARDQLAIGQRLGGAVHRHLVHARRGDELALRLRLAFARASRHAAFPARLRSEEHTTELQSLMRISYAVFCLKKKNANNPTRTALDVYIPHTTNLP